MFVSNMSPIVRGMGRVATGSDSTASGRVVFGSRMLGMATPAQAARARATRMIIARFMAMMGPRL